MDTVYERCAGLDVHKGTIEVTVRVLEGRRVRQSTRQFATHTRELLALSDWLQAEGVTHVAMESTGVYWKPVYNIFEGNLEVLLVNARHVKQVPGRKTDVKDSQWLAQLLQHGLLRGSFIPPPEIRDLRDLTRQRTQVVQEKVRVSNRIQKTLEDANIKLGSVASDVLGVSGRAMLQALIEGETDSEKLADLARRQLRGKIPQLRLALEGHMRDHHRFLLKLLGDHLVHLEKLEGQLNQRIEEAMRPFDDELVRLDEIPGVNRRLAEVLIAELGSDMSVFPTAQQLASWAGICPGNNQSAGKRKSGRTTKGSRWLRAALTQAAWAATRKKDSYLASQYRRLAGRRGKKRALIAVGHSILIAVYYILKDHKPYEDLGPHYLDQLDPKRLTRYYVKRLENLGHKVILEKDAA
jgi:transposase